MDKELNWVMEPYHRRTESEVKFRSWLLEDYVKRHNCHYLTSGDREEVTASPLPENKHSFTPVERVTLDYMGEF